MRDGDAVEAVGVLDGGRSDVGELEDDYLVDDVGNDGEGNAAGDRPDIGRRKGPHGVVEDVDIERIRELEDDHQGVNGKAYDEEDRVEAQWEEDGGVRRAKTEVDDVKLEAGRLNDLHEDRGRCAGEHADHRAHRNERAGNVDGTAQGFAHLQPGKEQANQKDSDHDHDG